MTDYLALLGRVNVGGNTVRMVDLRAAVEELGHSRVGTYIQTGNVFFHSSRRSADAVGAELAKHLSERFGFPVPTFVRTTSDLRALLDSDPFGGVDVADDIRHLVVPLDRELPAGLDFPVREEARGFTLLGSVGREALVVLRLVNGRPGNAVAWLEKTFGVQGTARFTHTLLKIVAAAEAGLG